MFSSLCHRSTLTTLYSMLPRVEAASQLNSCQASCTRLNLPHITINKPHTTQQCRKAFKFIQRFNRTPTTATNSFDLQPSFCTMMYPASANIHVGDKSLSLFTLSHFISKPYVNKVIVCIKAGLIENESGSNRMSLQCRSPDSIAVGLCR